MTARQGIAIGLLVVGAACSKSAPKEQGKVEGRDAAAPAPTPAPSGDAVVVADQGALWRVPLVGAPAKLADVDAAWCAADSRAGVVWVAAGRELRYYDAEGDRAMHVAVAGLPEETPDFVIDHGSVGKIGGESDVALRVGLELTLAATPKVAAVVGCEGDAFFYCYGDDGDVENPVLLPELQKQKDTIDKLAVADAKAIAALAARGGSRPLVQPLPDTKAAAIAVDRARCEEDPEACGEAQPLRATRFLLVTVGNSRGDFFHVERQLYDPQTKEFMSVRDPARRAAKPLAEAPDPEALVVADSGAGWAYGNVVVSAAEPRVVWTGSDDAKICGWLGPAWRVPGPTDSP
jgi:hypothetical protein